MKEMGVYNASYKLGIVKRQKSKNIATWNFLELAIKISSCNTWCNYESVQKSFFLSISYIIVSNFK